MVAIVTVEGKDGSVPGRGVGKDGGAGDVPGKGVCDDGGAGGTAVIEEVEVSEETLVLAAVVAMVTLLMDASALSLA